MTFRRLVLYTGAVVVLGAGGFGTWLACSQWVEAGHVGVMYNAATGLEKDAAGNVRVIRPQRVFVPWFHQLYTYPTMIQQAVYSQDPEEGEDKSADGIQIQTSDTATTTYDVVVSYRVRPEDVGRVFATFGPIDIKTIQAQHIRRAVKDAVNEISTRFDAFQLMGPAREEASNAMSKRLQEMLAPKGISVEQAMLQQAYPDAGLQGKINQRVNSLTDLSIAQIHQQKAEVEQRTAIIKASAESKARQLASSKTQAKSIEMMSLEADLEAVQAWDGTFPRYQFRPGQTVVLGQGALPQGDK